MPKRQLRILILNHNPEHYGTYFRCYRLGRELARRGHLVTMVCASGRSFDLHLRRQVVVGSGGRMTLLTLPRVKYHRYFTGQLVRLLLTLPIVIYGHYDVVHAFTMAQPQIAIPAILRRVLGRTPLVVDWDDLWGGGFAEAHAFPVRRVLSASERLSLRFADWVTVVSQSLYERSLRYGVPEAHISVVPNGCDVNSFPLRAREQARAVLGFDAEGPLVVSVGNTYTSSLDKLLGAFEHVLQRRTEARLVFVGTTIPTEVATSHTMAMHSIISTGPLPFEEAVHYMCAADVLALPMANDPIEIARFPIRFVDYLTSGRPIVSNAVGEVRKYLTVYKCGLAAPVDDIPGFGEALLQVVSDQQLAFALGKRARDLASGLLSLERVTSQVERVYDHAMAAAHTFFR